MTISLSFFIGMAMTVFDAGFPSLTFTFFVTGFNTFRGFVAGLCFSFKWSISAKMKDP